jgi:hypothetical protein
VTTPDGISTEDWNVVHELTVDLVNAEEGEAEEQCRHRLLEYLGELEGKYGPRPSLLATRADFMVDDVPGRLDLFSRAYALSAEVGDLRNQLHVASSLAELYIDELRDIDNASKWLSRAKDHVERIGNEVDCREYERVKRALERLRGHYRLMATSITGFQERCLEECRNLFRLIPALRYGDFEKIVGKAETYFKATADGPHHLLEVYVYEDEAGYMLDGKQWTIFEGTDYRSQNELLETFLKSLREKLLDIAK